MQVKTGERLVCSSSSSNTSHKCAAIEWGSSASVCACAARATRLVWGPAPPLAFCCTLQTTRHGHTTLHCTALHSRIASDRHIRHSASRPAEHMLSHMIYCSILDSTVHTPDDMPEVIRNMQSSPVASAAAATHLCSEHVDRELS